VVVPAGDAAASRARAWASLRSISKLDASAAAGQARVRKSFGLSDCVAKHLAILDCVARGAPLP
jgi:hypothetical protein